MKYQISITEIDEETAIEMVRYQQTVDYLDTQAVINAVNASRPQLRQRALRSDAGKPREKKEEQLP